MTYAIEGADDEPKIEIMRLLVAADPKVVDTPNEHEQTPLIYAVSANRRKAVELLLRKQAKVDWADSQGWTALAWAVGSTRDDIVPILIEAGARTDIKDKAGKTLLDIAREREGEWWADRVRKEFARKREPPAGR